MYFLGFSGVRDSDARLKARDFANNSNMTGVKISIQTLVKEKKLVLTFQDEFDF